MLGLERYGQPDGKKPGEETTMELSLYDNNGNLYLSAKYYATSGSLCIVETSEGEIFTTLWTDVSFFIKQVENSVNGREVRNRT